ncbi:hypothetical protein A3E35_02440 [Candidatus Giovannonibacteria bacterium RIFCSPHIGHO2_12_FULL_44_22]|nr:MAG: hypothetical protein A3E35_02440 [Candidatus Giovannonibacteria bacterium RIFCSPHIGHO2_12_FULL_44_22]
MKNLKIKNRHRGFSLLETTVATAILVAAVIGPLTLASSSIRSSSQAKNNLVAASLAQEGMELMRNYRAKNVFEGNSWIAGMGSCSSPAGCQIDATILEIAACGAPCSNLNLNQNSGLYSYDTVALPTIVPTIFIRTINIETVNTTEIKIKVSVAWQELFGLQKFTLEEHLLDW